MTELNAGPWPHEWSDDLFYADCNYCPTSKYENTERAVKSAIKKHIREKHPEVDVSEMK